MKSITSLLGIALLILGCGGSVPAELDQIAGELPQLNREAYGQMVSKHGLYDKRWNRSGGRVDGFELVKHEQGETIQDRGTGLKWHRYGAPENLTFAEAQRYIANLNRKKYAGITNWALPSVRELLSLTTKASTGNRHLSELFELSVPSCWSHTSSEQDGYKWTVSFEFGGGFSESTLAQSGVLAVSR